LALRVGADGGSSIEIPIVPTLDPRPWHGDAMNRRGTVLALALVMTMSGCTAASHGTLQNSATASGSSASTTSTATTTAVAATSALPSRHLTPGKVSPAITVAQVCAPGFAAKAVPVPSTRARAVFAAYKIAWSGHSAYQLDHLVPVSLGGSNATTNLWPQPHAAAASLHKDQLENRLHALVCTGHLKLASAQKAIRSNWVSAYQKYGGLKALTYPKPVKARPSPTRSPARTSPATVPPTTHAPHSAAPAPTTIDDHGGATAQCNDGTLSFSAHHQGTCSHHGGVAIWFR
jgi:hypothetical protein